MSRRAAAPVILSPAEERTAALAAQASALETLRVTHPALFSMRVSPDDPGVHCLRTRFGVDVTQDNLLSVLLRPHAKRICDSLAPHGRKEAPTAFMYFLVKEALNNLDVDVDDLEKIGVVSRYNSGYTEETYIHSQISYLREALYNLHRLKTKTQKAAEHAAIVEANRLENERRAAMREAEIGRRREAERQRVEQLAAVRAARGPRPPPEGDLLGLHPAAAAAANAEVNLLNMNAARKAEIASNLEGLFGGKSRTRKHKSRKARTSQKSRRHSRK